MYKIYECIECGGKGYIIRIKKKDYLVIELLERNVLDVMVKE